MPKKKQNPSSPLPPEKKKLADKIHRWAYTKDAKERTRLFNEIWEMRFGKNK